MSDLPTTEETKIASKYALDHLYLSFRDAAIEENYQNETLDKTLPYIRYYVGAGAMFYLLFGVLDALIVSGPVLHAIWTIRFGLVVPILVVILGLTYHRRFHLFAQMALSAAMLSTGFGVVAMTALLPPPFNGTYYAGIILVAAYCGTLIRLKFLYSSLTSLALIASYQCVALWVNPVSTAIYFNNTFFLGMATGVGIFTSYLHELSMRRAYVGEIIIRKQNDKSRSLLIEARGANKAKSEFLATMSHELRTPLNAICGFSEIIKGEMFGPVGQPQYAEYAEDIHSSGSHLLSIINDILDIAKAEAGKLVLSESTVDLSEAVQACTRMCRTSAEEKNVKVFHVGMDTPILVLADERLLRQAILNLLSNAIKFTESGGRVKVKLHSHAGGDVSIEIVDTGVGISSEDLSRVLRPFEQVEGAMARQNGGTGLGLPYSQKISEIHGGRLTLESALGLGTRCRIVLPQWRLVDVADADAVEMRHAG